MPEMKRCCNCRYFNGDDDFDKAYCDEQKEDVRCYDFCFKYADKNGIMIGDD